MNCNALIIDKTICGGNNIRFEREPPNRFGAAEEGREMGKKNKKPGKGKEKTERKTAKAEEKKARRESKKVSPEDDIDAILVFFLNFLLQFCS